MKITNLLASVLMLLSFSLNAQLWIVEKRVNPKYPIKAVKNNIEGCVRLQFFINSDGLPQYIESIKSSAPIFNEAAIKALSKWRFAPTDNNSNKLPERQTVELSFFKSSNVDFNTKCDAQMTVEPNDINVFRQHRLSMPIDATSLLSLNKSIAKIVTVLSDDELRHFLQSYSELISGKSGLNIEKHQVLLNAINGLDYFQLIDLANVEQVENSNVLNRSTEKESTVNTDQFPLISMKKFFHTWELNDLAIHMNSELYKEISYRLLEVELLIRKDGTAQLLSTCRKVSNEMKEALEESIGEWKITNKVKSPSTVRFVYRVPAPAEDGAYIDCDYDWRS